MPLYSLKTIAEDGSVAVLDRSAPSRSSLEETAEREGLVLLKVEERENVAATAGKSGKIKLADLNELLIYLSITHSSGIPLTTALDEFSSRVKGARFKAILTDIYGKVMRGKSLSDSLAEYQKYFGLILVNIVRAGEESGALDEILERYRKQLEWQIKIKAVFKQAMIYPAFLFTAVLGLVVLLLTFLLPSVMNIFEETDIELPVLTQALVSISDFLIANGVPFLAVLLAIPIGITTAKRFRKSRQIIDRIVYRIPIFGRIASEIALARFTVVLQTLIASGVEIARALEIAGSSSGSTYIKTLSQQVIEQIRVGKDLSTAFVVFDDISPLLSRMVAIGEKSGKIVQALNNCYRYFDTSIPTKVKRTISILEPAIIMVAGVLVGVILLGTMMPMYSIYSEL
jgi:type IV pilus assembly protein PilC